MGNLCGKQEADPFAQPGRRLGSAPAPSPATAPIPAGAASRKATGPPQAAGSGAPPSSSNAGAADDARRKAAVAAEVRYYRPLFPSCFSFFVCFPSFPLHRACDWIAPGQREAFSPAHYTETNHQNRLVRKARRAEGGNCQLSSRHRRSRQGPTRSRRPARRNGGSEIWILVLRLSTTTENRLSYSLTAL